MTPVSGLGQRGRDMFEARPRVRDAVRIAIVGLLMGIPVGVLATRPQITGAQDKTEQVEARLGTAVRSSQSMLMELRASRAHEALARSNIAALQAQAQRDAAEIAQQQVDLATAKSEADRADAAVAAASSGGDPTPGTEVVPPPAHVDGGSIVGDGVLGIGADVQAGTWHSEGGEGCYHAILNSADNTDIASNDTTSGPVTVELPAGKFFETIQCGTWTRQG